jgi:hypothetical protein
MSAWRRAIDIPVENRTGSRIEQSRILLSYRENLSFLPSADTVQHCPLLNPAAALPHQLPCSWAEQEGGGKIAVPYGPALTQTHSSSSLNSTPVGTKPSILLRA